MFEFYYQTGEYASSSSDLWDFFKNLIVQLVGTAIAGLLALALYFQGKADQQLKEERQQIEKHLDNLKYFIFLLKESITVIESMSETFYEVSDELNYKTKSPNLSFTFPYESITRIAKTINQQEVYHSYQNVITYFNISFDRESISKIFQIIDVVYINLPNLQQHYLDHSKQFTETYNSLIDNILKQNKVITDLYFGNNNDSRITPLMDIINRYNKSKPQDWYESCKTRQLEMNNFFNANITKNFNLLQPVSSSYTDIAQLLLKFDAYHASFKSWADENAPHMHKYSFRLRARIFPLVEFIKEQDLKSQTDVKIKVSFFTKIARDIRDLLLKKYYTVSKQEHDII